METNKHTIPELHKTLEQLNSFFKEKSYSFCQAINKHEGTFTEADYCQFTAVIETIKEYAISSIQNFFSRKIHEKCQPYENKIFQFSEHSTLTCNSLKKFRDEIEDSTFELKKKKKRQQELIDHISLKYSSNQVLKKCMKILKKNAEYNKQKRKIDHEMEEVYHRNLLKKAFSPWHALTYKDGYANTVSRETSEDLMQIHAQYQSIVNVLKSKITDTEQMIKIKKAAKGQFAYALNKNLLKTISNLSMEVMSLNQLTLHDSEVSQRETKQFMQQIDGVITQKLNKVRQFRTSITGESQLDKNTTKNKKIRFS